MSTRPHLAVMLGLALSAAALVTAPGAWANDGAVGRGVGVDKDTASCMYGDPDADSTVRLKILPGDDGRLTAVGSVFSDDSDVWEWKLKHNSDYSASGIVKARDANRSFRIERSMIDLIGDDVVTFRAENDATGEVCVIDVDQNSDDD